MVWQEIFTKALAGTLGVGLGVILIIYLGKLLDRGEGALRAWLAAVRLASIIRKEAEEVEARNHAEQP